MLTIETKDFVFVPDTIAQSCHASTVLPLPSGVVLSAFFAGEREGANDVRIWVVRRVDDKWGEPICIPSPGGDIPHWNPVLDLRNDGTVCLYYKVGYGVREWRTWFVLSKDEGLTWSEPQVLVPGDNCDGRGPVKNKCIRISNGTLLAPASTEIKRDWRAFIDISEDDGVTWQKQKFMVRARKNGEIVKPIQPTLWESENGHIHALMRTNSGSIYRSDSKDYGRTWRKIYETSLPNNNSGIDCVKVPDGRVFLLYNPTTENWGARSPLNLGVSEDNGVTWTVAEVLETQEGGEFSYPAITFFDGCLHMTYTYNRKSVAYLRVKI